MSATSESAFPKTGESNAGLPITLWIAALCLYPVFNTYVAASANRADADPAMPVFCWLAPNDLRLYVIDTYVREAYMVNNDDTIADSG
jgi:hypothetical protein